MRVVEVITGLDPGGAEHIVLELVRALADRGEEPHVVCLLPFPENRRLLDALVPVASSVRSLEVDKSRPWRILRLGTILDGIAPSLVHSHLYHANLAARLALLRRPTPLINTLHNADPRLSKYWLFLLDRLSRKRCDVYTAVSHAVAAFHAARIGVPTDRIEVIPNGSASIPALTPDQIRSLRQAWGVENCRRVFGAVGRLHSQKGFDRLLQVLPRYASGIPQGVRDAVVILGDGPEMPRLRRLAAGMPANLQVVLPGFWPNAAAATGAFDVFLMPSRYEGFGLAAADAMGHGIPVVVSTDESLRETTAEYDRAFGADFDDPGAAAGVMNEAAGTGIPRKPYVPLSLEAMSSRYLALYDRLLS